MNPSPWLPFNHLNSAIPRRLFCFPYAGGNPQFFRAWQTEMPSDIEIFPVQLPGRGMRFAEASFTDINQLIPRLADALLLYMDRPFFFFGHSMGALLSFELARYIKQHHQLLPQKLIVSGFHAPQLPDPNPPIHHLPEQEFIAGVIEMNGMPKEIIAKKEFLEVFIPFLRADFTLCEQYRFGDSPKLSCPVTVFGGRDDPETDRKHLEAWQECTSGSFELIMFSGDHFFIHEYEQEVIQSIASQMKQTASQSK